MEGRFAVSIGAATALARHGGAIALLLSAGHALYEGKA
jgi:hypothetical protein